MLPGRARNPERIFGLLYLPDTRTVYCNFRGYHQLKGNAAALFREIKQRNANQLVIDLRQNGGGDYHQGLRYLVDPIRDHSALNRKGHLFVLIGVNTFSAAMSNATQFRAHTEAILVGEPIGETPNSYPEAREMHLPNSQLVVRYSTKYDQFLESGENIVRPDQEVITSWDDHRAGRDPVLDWALSYGRSRPAGRPSN